jgi:hypothetical protein
MWRIGIDFLREGTSFLFDLHQAQVIGIIVLLIVIPLLVLRTRWVSPQNVSNMVGMVRKDEDNSS